LKVSPGDEFLDEEPGHDGLASARVIGQQEAERLPRQHAFVNGGDLVGEGVHDRGVDRENGVEKVRETDTLRLRNEPKEGSVSVETPGSPRFNKAQARFVVTIDQLIGHATGWVPVDQCERIGPVPLGIHNHNGDIRKDSSDTGGRCEVFEFHGKDWRMKRSNVAVIEDIGVASRRL
jgi:hypothetical protein